MSALNMEKSGWRILGDLKYARQIAVVLFGLLIASFSVLHFVKGKYYKSKAESSTINFHDGNPKLIYIQNVSSNQRLVPPYGDINVVDLVTKEHVRLNYDGCYDMSPTLSKNNNCIYFISIRDEDGEALELGSPEDIYKLDLESFEISKARSDFDFLDHKSIDQILEVAISPFNDSIMGLLEWRKREKVFSFYNYVDNTKLIEVSEDSVYRFWYAPDRVVFQSKGGVWGDPNKIYEFNYVTKELKPFGDFYGLTSPFKGILNNEFVFSRITKGDNYLVGTMNFDERTEKELVTIKKREQFWLKNEKITYPEFILGKDKVVYKKYGEGRESYGSDFYISDIDGKNIERLTNETKVTTDPSIFW